MASDGSNKADLAGEIHEVVHPEAVDVVIIGAGLSGLSAARLLASSNQSVVVLEARDRVGGRLYSIQDPHCGGYTDLGGSFVGPTQRRVARLARQLGLELYRVHDDEDTVMATKDVWTVFHGLLPSVLNPVTILDLNAVFIKLDAMSKQIPLDAPWKAPFAAEWDLMTVKEFLDKECWTSFARDVIAHVWRTILATEMHEISVLFLCWYIATGQGFLRLIGTSNGAQERKFKGGSMRLPERMAAELDPGRVRFNSAVISVQQDLINATSAAGERRVTIKTSDGKTISAKYVISAVPLALTNRIQFIPALPPRKLQLIQRVPMGSVIKTMTFYDKPFWRSKGYSGQLLVDDIAGQRVWTFDDTKPDGKAPCLLGFVTGDHARRQMTSDERKRLLTERYAKYFESPELLNPVHYVEKNWAEEEFSGGCYVGTMAPGVLTQFGDEISRPFHQVFFAGTETAAYWVGYMEGAVEAGERAAREVLHAMGKIAESEIRQQEPPAPDFTEISMEPNWIQKVLPSPKTFLVGLSASVAGLSSYLISKL